MQIDGLPFFLRMYARYALAVIDQRRHSRVVPHVDARLLRRGVEVLHQPCAAARDFDRHAPEELALASDHAGLPAVIGHEARTLRAQPSHRVETLCDQYFG